MAGNRYKLRTAYYLSPGTNIHWKSIQCVWDVLGEFFVTADGKPFKQFELHLEPPKNFQSIQPSFEIQIWALNIEKRLNEEYATYSEQLIEYVSL